MCGGGRRGGGENSHRHQNASSSLSLFLFKNLPASLVGIFCRREAECVQPKKKSKFLGKVFGRKIYRSKTGIVLDIVFRPGYQGIRRVAPPVPHSLHAGWERCKMGTVISCKGRREKLVFRGMKKKKIQERWIEGQQNGTGN